MSAIHPLAYTRTEVQSYLPGGWVLGSGSGAWDAKRGFWKTKLLDPTGVDWDLQVKPSSKPGADRLETLRLAVDKLYRNALG